MLRFIGPETLGKELKFIYIIASTSGFKCTVALVLFLTCSCLGVKVSACVEYLLFLAPTIFIRVQTDMHFVPGG